MRKAIAIMSIVFFSYFLVYNLRRFLSIQYRKPVPDQQVEYINNYSGVVSKKVIIGCDCIVELSSKSMIRFPWADNLSVKPKHLCQFLVSGDSITKPSNSDSLFIYRSNNENHFVLRKRIWR